VAVSFVPGELDLDSALSRMDGNTAILGRVLQSFAKSLQQAPEQLAGHLQHALQTGQMTESVRMLHTLKGLSATVGARHLAAVTADLEHRCITAVPKAEQARLVTTLQVAVQATAHSVQEALVKLALTTSSQNRNGS